MSRVMLLESEDFLVVSLNSIMQNSNKSAGGASSEANSEVDLQISAEKGMDWDKEYKEKVKGKGDEQMKAFLKQYFETEWEDPSVAEAILALGMPLILEFERRGFSTKINPYIHFFKQNFVIEKLLKTKKLDQGVFTAICDAVVDKKIAMLELIKTNDYNIIYCLDFYEKSITDAYKYLKHQNLILKNSKNPSIEVKQQNKEVFFGDKNANIEAAKLIDLANLKEIDPKNNTFDDEEDEDITSATNKSLPIDDFISEATEFISQNKLTKRDILQYIGIASKNPELMQQAAKMRTTQMSTLDGMKLLAKYFSKKLPTQAEIKKVIQELELFA